MGRFSRPWPPTSTALASIVPLALLLLAAGCGAAPAEPAGAAPGDEDSVSTGAEAEPAVPAQEEAAEGVDEDPETSAQAADDAPPEAEVAPAEPAVTRTSTCPVENCPWLHLPTDPDERAAWAREWSARFRRPPRPPADSGAERRWMRFDAGRVLDALGVIEVGMTRATVLRWLGPPDDGRRGSDYFSYELSPVAAFTVEFEHGRVTSAGYGADSGPPGDVP